jgi:two-component system sensor histidine kinase HydH
MMGELPTARRPSTATIWICILAAVTLVAVLGTVIGIYDVGRAVVERREEELLRLRLNAERTAGQIESQLLEDGAPSNLDDTRNAVWLRRYWTQNFIQQPGRIYAAVVDRRGTIIAHTRQDKEGQRVISPPDGTGGILTATELMEMSEETLTFGRRAIDVRVPIVVNSVQLGIYHTGLDAEWLEDQMALVRQSRTTFWSLLVSGMSCLLLLSSVAVVWVTRRTARLEHELEAANARRVTEMHELVLGVAHEIRNPLNAIRLNLHTIGQVFRDQAALGDEEIASMLDETEGEVERLENLMREMLGFARPSREQASAIDLGDEIQRTLSFLRPNLEQQRITVNLNLPETPCLVPIGATRLRQVLLNLLNNALEALADGGMIEIDVRTARGQAEITIADDGPGIPMENRERVFVPFFSTKSGGTGLGLPVARKFIEEAGGTIVFDESPLRNGCRVRIVLPATSGAVVQGVP